MYVAFTNYNTMYWFSCIDFSKDLGSYLSQHSKCLTQVTDTEIYQAQYFHIRYQKKYQVNDHNEK